MNTQTVTYGDFPIRLLAVLIDVMILLPVDLLMRPIFDGNLFLNALANLLVTGLYCVAFTCGRWQATPGKRLLNLYVTDKWGKALQPKQATARYLAYLMPSLPMYSSLQGNTAEMMVLCLGILWFSPVIWTVQKTGVHDMLCDTRVRVGKINA
jgi:uncharacterized RDD family membrane protein YckC